LKKSVRDFFNHGRSCASMRPRHWGILPGTKQKERFLLYFIFSNTYVFEKWRRIYAPHRGLLKNLGFSTARDAPASRAFRSRKRARCAACPLG
ncbi:MAG: hypothetical protein AB1469_04180, partial [Pseudomonadota bacterium]